MRHLILSFLLLIAVSAIGQPPTIPASNIAFTSVKCNEFTVSWTNGNGTYRIVFIKEGSSIGDIPVENEFYSSSSIFGKGESIKNDNTHFCVYRGTSNTVTVTGLKNNTKYFVAVFEYNANVGSYNYLTSTYPKNDTTTKNIVANGYVYDIRQNGQKGQCLNSNSFQFKNKSSSDITPVTYSWKFGDGDSSNINEPKHSYKSIGIKNPKNISHIEIQPIIDVYNFVNYSAINANITQNTQNFELVKLLAEDGDINKVIKDKTTSKNYYRHNIVIITKGLASEENLIKPLLDFLNQNEYFNVLQKITSENLIINMKQNQEMIIQINKLLDKFSSESDPSVSKLVVNTDSSQLNDILKTKQTLVLELGTQREQLINLNSIIKKNSSIINITKSDTINGNLKFVLPLFLIFGFIFIYLFSSFYKKQSLKALQNKA